MHRWDGQLQLSMQAPKLTMEPYIICRCLILRVALLCRNATPKQTRKERGRFLLAAYIASLSNRPLRHEQVHLAQFGHSF